MNSADQLFISRREHRLRYWPWVGAGSLLMWLLLAVGLWRWVPHLINPWAVIAGLEAASLPESTLQLMAVLLPLLVLTLLCVVGAGIGLAFVVFANERRLLRIIRQQQT